MEINAERKIGFGITEFNDQADYNSLKAGSS